jgi:hypothetical protein
MQGRQGVKLILAFEKDTIVQRVVFECEGKVAGLVFRPKTMAILPQQNGLDSSARHFAGVTSSRSARV